ncbi:acyl-CoA dehydrogenase family protein [Sphingomonas tabacisoli]|uniref:Acyl-CoA dehydrogenase family protein n=1 Tax=Sphingomonas tabacisoli TaxID=2249466 RepID=A0ABW4I183_9SPHN
MNFDFSEEQTMLSDMVRRFVEDRYDVERRRSFRKEAAGFSAANWDALCELGLLGLSLPSDQGGAGLDWPDLMIVAIEIGRGQVVEPILSAWLTIDLLGRSPGAEGLDTVVAGRSRLAYATGEFAVGADGLLSGRADFVLDGDGVDGFLIESGNAIHRAAADAAGLEVTSYRIADGSIAVAIDCRQVRTEPLDLTPHKIDDCLQRARFATAAEALGVMDRMFADTLAYVKTRQQFGRAIGTFQTIQHRMARLYTELEQCRSLLYKAALVVSAERARAIFAAQACIDQAAMHLAHECVQFHGGIGITEELGVAQGHKRLMVLSRLFGTAADARQRFMEAY